METEIKVILAPASAFLVILLASFFIGNFTIASNMIFLGMMVLIIPYSLYKFFEHKKIRAYEEAFPLFLRDISESQRSE